MSQHDYAEAWAWVHFLLETEPRRRELLHGYLAELRQDGTAAPLSTKLSQMHLEPERTLVEHVVGLAAVPAVSSQRLSSEHIAVVNSLKPELLVKR